VTWYYSIGDSGRSVEVYDHTGQLVASITNQPVNVPGTILEVMEQEAMSGGTDSGLTKRQVAILRDAIFRNIEEGKPS